MGTRLQSLLTITCDTCQVTAQFNGISDSGVLAAAHAAGWTTNEARGTAMRVAACPGCSTAGATTATGYNAVTNK